MAWSRVIEDKIKIVDATPKSDGYFHREDMNLIRNQKRGIKAIKIVNVEIYEKSKNLPTGPDNRVLQTQMVVAVKPDAVLTRDGITNDDLMLSEGNKVAYPCPPYRHHHPKKEIDLASDPFNENP